MKVVLLIDGIHNSHPLMSYSSKDMIQKLWVYLEIYFTHAQLIVIAIILLLFQYSQFGFLLDNLNVAISVKTNGFLSPI